MNEALLQVQDLGVQASGTQILHGLNFEVQRGEVLAIVGASGCGKSTLLRHLMGLELPSQGQILLAGANLYQGHEPGQALQQRQLGVMFQAGALWSSMSVGDNITLPMRLHTTLSAAERQRRARHKLALVGLDEAYDWMPATLSGGMRKRAALARALALDPPLLLLDEPGSGLDPVSASKLDDLICHLRQDLGTTIVMVSHDISSVFAVADRLLFLDHNSQTMSAIGSPHDLLQHGPAEVRAFLQHGRPS